MQNPIALSSDPSRQPSSRPPNSNLGTSQSIGPCYLKLLVSNIVAGSIIGQKGTTIASISSKTGCTIRLSHSSCYFPGTIDRVVAMWGTLEQIRDAFLIVLEKVRDAPASAAESFTMSPPVRSETTPGKMISKIVVPNSAVSQLIGKQGQTIKELQETTGTKIQISNRDEHHFKERVVIISGTFDAVCKASFDVMEAVQGDPHLKDHTEINYVVSLPVVIPQNLGASHGVLFPGSGGMMGGGRTGGGLSSPNDLMRSMLQSSPATTSGYFPFFGQHGLNPNEGIPGGPIGQSASGLLPSVMASGGSGSITAHFDIPDSFVGFTIGKQGATLQVIQQQSGAKLHVSGKGDYVPGTENRRVTITGHPASVQIAQMLLQQKMREIEELTSQKGPGGRLFSGRPDGLSSPNPVGIEHGHNIDGRLPVGLGLTMNGNFGHSHPHHGGMQTFPQSHQGGFSQFSTR